jgi:peptidoglycan/LPS O-acetylase OafA/YrhL
MPIDSDSSKRQKFLLSSIYPRNTVSKASGYDSGIDVVRFLAFFLVFLHHFVYRGGNSITANSNSYWTSPFANSVAFFGAEGVTIFFCLSGYLLSKILIKELKDTGRLSVRSFYFRRILRIWPLYFSFLVFCLIVAPFLGNQTVKGSELPSLITFTYNWQQIYTGQSRGMPAILWSISVEEQIYLVLPLLLLLFSRRSFKTLAFSLIFLGLVSRVFLYTNDLPMYRNTFSYMSTIGIGMLYSIYDSQIKIRYYQNRLIFNLAFCAGIAFYILFFESRFSIGVLSIFAFDFTAMTAISLLILFSGKEGGLFGLLLKPFAFLGRRTYGMYIFHWPILGLMVSKNIFFSPSTGV